MFIISKELFCVNKKLNREITVICFNNNAKMPWADCTQHFSLFAKQFWINRLFLSANFSS